LSKTYRYRIEVKHGIFPDPETEPTPIDLKDMVDVTFADSYLLGTYNDFPDYVAHKIFCGTMYGNEAGPYELLAHLILTCSGILKVPGLDDDAIRSIRLFMATIESLLKIMLLNVTGKSIMPGDTLSV
jgi:hypothetical protein